MIKPLITIYITNHNYGRFISKSIDSVLNQSFKKYELIIIDDGSTDNSINIINRYCKKNKDINEDSLVDATRSYIAGYKLPKKVIFVEQVERAPNGKANYKWAKNIANESSK